jgi:hypothetical protein
MNCKYHSTFDAVAICERCNNPICTDCAIKVNEKVICHQCIKQNFFPEPQTVAKKPLGGKFLFFCFSLIPGAAHMFMGLFRRGLQLMLITFGVLSFTSYLGLEFLIPMVVIPTWFFSFFEGYHLRREMNKGQAISDQDLFNRQLFDYTPILKNTRVIGSVIIVIGILGLLRTLESSAVVLRIFHGYYYLIKDSFVPLLLIAGGVYLLLKAKQKPIQDVSEN